MKLPSHSSFPQSRALIAATFALLFGAATAVAQSGSSGSSGSTSGSSSSTPASTSTPSASSTSSSSRDSSSGSNQWSSHPTTNPADASSYHSGAAADVDSTKEINAQSGATGAGAMTGRDSNGKNKLSWMDRRFVNKVADEGADEIALAKLAADRASNPEVKSFAQKLVEDHEQVASDLKSMAAEKNVKLDEDNDHDRSYKRLEKRSGADFDREFVEHMIDDHEKDIKLFEKAAKDAKDSDVRSFASKHVDHLRQHLQMAEGLRQSVMPTGRTNDNSGRSSSTTPLSNDDNSSTTSSKDASSTNNYGSGGSSSDHSSSSGTNDSSASNTNSSSDTGSSTTQPPNSR